MRAPALILACCLLSFSGCLAPSHADGAMQTDPAEAPAATTPAAKAWSVALAGNLTFHQGAAATACPVKEDARVQGEMSLAALNITGADSVDLTIEWTPVHPIMQSARFWLRGSGPAPPSSGSPVVLGSQPGPFDEFIGSSPLTLHLDAAQVAARANGAGLMLAGPACDPEAPPAQAARDFTQTATFHGEAHHHG